MRIEHAFCHFVQNYRESANGAEGRKSYWILANSPGQALIMVTHSQKLRHQHTVWVRVDANPARVESKAEKMSSCLQSVSV